MTEKNAFELVVIGGGPGGYVGAIRAAQLGFRVAVVEGRSRLGGTCMNVGCIPSKALLASTELYHLAHDQFPRHGIITEGLSFDLAKMMARKEQVVEQLGKGLEMLMKKNKIEVFSGWASLQDPHTIEVLPEEGPRFELAAENILLATGSSPVELPFLPSDGKRVITSDEAIALKEVPGKLAVIGAGAIGLELASVWNRLGSEVTILEFLPRIAAGFDEEISKHARRLLEKQGLKIHTSTQVESAQVSAGGVKLKAIQDGKAKTFSADQVLVAVGRKPHTDGLRPEGAGVEMTDRGWIRINARWQTSVPNIYAIGDVVEGPMLAHKAEEEGVAVAEILAGKPGHVNAEVIPNVIYTAPEIAAVGLSEETAKEKGLEIRVGKFPFQANGRALANGVTDGFVKVIADAHTDRVLGVQMIAPTASDLIAECVLLMEFGGSAEDLARTVHAHPTSAEAIREAALAVGGRSLHS